jgi:para-aminobenzoate synthetase component 1
MKTHRNYLIGEINRYSRAGTPFVFAVDFDQQKGFVKTPEEAASEGILCKAGDWQNYTGQAAMAPRQFSVSPVEYPVYLKAFEKVQYHLRRGDTYLLNLTFPTPVQTDSSLQELFHAGHAPFKLLVPGQFAIFSPEAFVTIQNGEISSCPMKGTISADLPDARERLLSDEKELYEHNTIVDLIRNDLSMVATGVSVRRFRYLEKIRTNRGDLWQMSSEISGKLTEDYRKELGTILFRLLPAGSVTGAPKEKTVQIIREAENDDRGFYTGIFGYFNGETLRTAVTIRYIEQTGNGMVFRSGGGITALSDPQPEYRELISKVYLPCQKI